MRAEFDLYVRRNTWLHRLDPRVKLLFVLEATLSLFIWPTIWAAAAMIVLCSLLLWSAQIPNTHIVRVWRMMAPLVVFVFLLTVLFGGDASTAWLYLGPLPISFSAIQLGAMLALRLLALALVIFVWLFTTDQATMVRGFVALGVPYEWGLILALALRYLPIFAGLFVQVREAQQARGLDLDQGSLWQRLQAHRPVLVAMVISAVRQSEFLGRALESRALGAQGIRRTTFRPLHMRRPDWLGVSILMLTLLGQLGFQILRTVM